jgi:hypothetical protein
MLLALRRIQKLPVGYAEVNPIGDDRGTWGVEALHEVIHDGLRASRYRVRGSKCTFQSVPEQPTCFKDGVVVHEGLAV